MALIPRASGENPAIQLALTDKGLQTVRHFAAGVIQDKLDEVRFPEVRGKIAGIDYTLSGMQINKCDLPEPSVHFSPNVSGLDLSVIGLSVAVTGDWATRWAFIHDGGTFDLAVFDLSVRFVLTVSRDSGGRLSMSSVSCDADVQSVDLRFYGGASWMFQWLVKYFTGHIKEKVQTSICPSMEDAIDNLEQHLQAMNVSVDVNSVMSLELPLSASPAVDPGWMNFGLRGEFLSVETQHDPPFVAPPFSLPIPSSRMVSMGVSEYTANSASFAYYDSGHLQAVINDSMIPPFCPVRLNTSSMGQYIPQLPKKFPNLLMSLLVYARQIPFFSFELGFVKLNVPSAIKAFAIQPNSTLTPLFKLNVDSMFSGKMWVDSEKFKSTLNMDNFTLSLDSTEIGPFKTDALENIAKLGTGAALKKINNILQQGYDLPKTKNVQLLNSVLSVEKGFITFSSDAKLQSTF